MHRRPLFEYSCELWDNCGTDNSNKLEQLQIEDSRIAIGWPIFIKIEMLYRDTGWELLAARRNIVNKTSPDYLYGLIFPTIQSTIYHSEMEVIY